MSFTYQNTLHPNFPQFSTNTHNFELTPQKAPYLNIEPNSDSESGLNWNIMGFPLPNTLMIQDNLKSINSYNNKFKEINCSPDDKINEALINENEAEIDHYKNFVEILNMACFEETQSDSQKNLRSLSSDENSDSNNQIINNKSKSTEDEEYVQFKINKNEEENILLGKKTKKINKEKEILNNNQRNIKETALKRVKKTVYFNDSVEKNQKIPSFLGTKEEFEKFFKNDKQNNQLSSKDQQLVDLINKPRRKKNNQIDSKNDLLILEGNYKKKRENQVQGYSDYLNDLNLFKKDRKHVFMMENFPLMYNETNFTLFIKGTQDHYKSSALENITLNIPQENSKESLNLKNLWSTGIFEENKITDYLYSCERYWPNQKYNFSQEICLSLLKEENFIVEKALGLIKSNNLRFKNLLKNKGLEISQMM